LTSAKSCQNCGQPNI